MNKKGRSDFAAYVRGHRIWKKIEGDMRLEDFIQTELAHCVLTSSLLSGELDAIPMQVIYDFVEEELYDGRGRPDDRFGRDGFHRKIKSLIERTHEALKVQSRVFGGKRYSCLVVKKGARD